MKKTYEVKTIEEAHIEARKDFELPIPELDFNIIKEVKGFLGIGNKLEVEVFIKEDGVEKGREYAKQILENCDCDNFIEKKVRDNHVELNIDTKKENGLFIGKNAKTLQALQTLVSTVINRYFDEENKKTVIVDVGGYKKKREKNLEFLAVDCAKKVMYSKKPIRLTRLNSYERRIIHDKLTSWKGITTHSEDEESGRVLIISSTLRKEEKN